MTGAPLLLFGGSFDPPHRAHLRMAETALKASGAEGVIFLPAAQSPHKGAPGASAEDRVALLRRALADDVIGERSKIDLREVERPGPSWFVETLRSIHHDHPDQPIRFLIGADQALAFHRWRCPEEILQLARPLVVLRPPMDRAAFIAALSRETDASRAAWWAACIIPAPSLPDASTDVRHLIAEGRWEEARLQVGDAVLEEIRRRGLYGAHPAG